MEAQLFLVSFLLSAPLLYLLFIRYFHRHRHLLPPSAPWRLPIIGHMHLLGPILHQSLHHLSLKNGPFFSLHFGSVPSVVASSPHFAKLILQANENAFNSRIITTAVKRLTYDSSLAFAPYGDYWRFIKKLSMNNILGSRSVHNFQHLRAQETRRLLGLLADKAKACQAVNMTDEVLKLTNNVISMMMLGESEEARDIVRGVTQIAGEFNLSDFIWLFKKLDLQGFRKRIEDLFHRFDAVVESVICKREELRKNKRAENDEFRDFLDILLHCVHDENSEVKINRTHIKALVMDFFTAGTDTLAIAIEWALLELIRKPLVLQKAQEEIDNVVGKSRLVEEFDIPKLPYLQAIIKETLRLHPPVPMVSRRCVADCNIENYVIPKNTLVFVNVWSIGRNPNYWENPLEFRPERFLKLGEEGYSTGLIDVRSQHFEYLPFGFGRRMCHGLNLAMLEVPALLGAVIQCFDFQVMDSKGQVLKGDMIDVNERSGLTAPRAQNLVCVPVERSGHSPLKI